MNRSDPNRSFLLAWTLWASFLSGLAMLLFFAYFQQARLGAVIHLALPIVWLRTAGYVFTIILFPIIGGIKRGLERKGAGIRGPASTGFNLAGLILALVLAESIGIVGFLLFLAGDDLQTLYLFIGLSALAMLLHRPKIEWIR